VDNDESRFLRRRKISTYRAPVPRREKQTERGFARLVVGQFIATDAPLGRLRRRIALEAVEASSRPPLSSSPPLPVPPPPTDERASARRSLRLGTTARSSSTAAMRRVVFHRRHTPTIAGARLSPAPPAQRRRRQQRRSTVDTCNGARDLLKRSLASCLALSSSKIFAARLANCSCSVRFGSRFQQHTQADHTVSKPSVTVTVTCTGRMLKEKLHSVRRHSCEYVKHKLYLHVLIQREPQKGTNLFFSITLPKINVF